MPTNQNNQNTQNQTANEQTTKNLPVKEQTAKDLHAKTQYEKDQMVKEQPASNLNQNKEVTIKFGRGLIGKSFQSKAGKTMLEIKIPNQNPNDKSPWASFVIPEGYVHQNQFGKGVWMKLPAEGTTKLSRSTPNGRDESGKTMWKNEVRFVSNLELKELLETYKDKEKKSALGELKDCNSGEKAGDKKTKQKSPKNDNPSL